MRKAAASGRGGKEVHSLPLPSVGSAGWTSFRGRPSVGVKQQPCSGRAPGERRRQAQWRAVAGSPRGLWCQCNRAAASAWACMASNPRIPSFAECFPSCHSNAAVALRCIHFSRCLMEAHNKMNPCRAGSSQPRVQTHKAWQPCLISLLHLFSFSSAMIYPRKLPCAFCISTVLFG